MRTNRAATHGIKRAGARRRAFTLVELLVVIGIVALLIAMLLPALNKARRASQVVACQSNLRQLAMWGMMYASDWKGMLPSHGDAAANGWPEIATTTWYSKAGEPYKLYRGFSVKYGTVMHCPAAVNVPVRQFSLGITYGLNQYVGGRQTYGALTAPRPITKLLHARTFWFADARYFVNMPNFDFHPILGFGGSGPPNGNVNINWPWNWDTRSDGGFKLDGHPNETNNFAFGDGHVEGITANQFMKMSNAERRKFVGYPF